MARKAEHVHRYRKLKSKFVSIWKCVEGCAHFIHQSQEIYLIGRKSLCNGCGKVFTIDEEAIEEDEPRCIMCRIPELAGIVQNPKFAPDGWEQLEQISEKIKIPKDIITEYKDCEICGQVDDVTQWRALGWSCAACTQILDAPHQGKADSKVWEELWSNKHPTNPDSISQDSISQDSVSPSMDDILDYMSKKGIK